MAEYPGQRRIRAFRDERRFDWRLWFAWVAATVGGWAVGEFVSLAFVDEFLVAAWLRGANGVGVAVAVLQALVLRRRLTQPAWWIVAGGIGGVVGPVLSTVANASVYIAYGVHGLFVATVALTALGLGALVGTLQWLVLRRQVAGAGRWALVSGVAMLIGVFVGGIVGYSIVELIVNLPDGWRESGSVQGLVSAILYGAITGNALVRLLPSQRLHADEPRSVPH